MIHVFSPYYLFFLSVFSGTKMNLYLQFKVLTGAPVHICEVLKMIIVPDDGVY